MFQIHNVLFCDEEEKRAGGGGGEGGNIHKHHLDSMALRQTRLFWECTQCVFYARVFCTGPQLDVHLSAAVMLIGSQFKEFFPLQMADAGRGKCTHAHTDAHIHTQLIQGVFFTSRKHQARFRFVRLVEKTATLKCFRDAREKPVFLTKMPTKKAAVKMQKGLPACHCC